MITDTVNDAYLIDKSCEKVSKPNITIDMQIKWLKAVCIVFWLLSVALSKNSLALAHNKMQTTLFIYF